MKLFESAIRISKSILLGDRRPVIFSGPCAIENEQICMDIAGTLNEISQKLDFDLVFKASFDKANRTAVTSFRTAGIEQGLGILSNVKKSFSLPVLTDIHESDQAATVAEVVDVLQIPAFLCRQTDLLLAAGRTGKAVKIKKGQFMAAEDMQYAIEKVKSTGNNNVFLTERGTSFGYHDLIVDMRSLPVMRQYAPVVFDVTHSVQQPGAQGGSSGGNRSMAPFLAKAAAASGVDGFFVETHPNPDKALSDGPNMIPLVKMHEFLEMLLDFWRLEKRSSFEI
ncbi:2-Keto-3-deoxy-D-manno-octulosonate-8-phosphate synthase [Indibacter alkaliphilus LW1]|uniref:2-dehydro-3-deoxyphosphooctonate aldolase n=1 Tax=Indibacter alkaliphilus (strain CCUG 57479 / KCTC 22604 / LW1) TaxID=1189612 RepID=S2E3I9_INDAL|nr:3-deoxy-8-phosphooctulonate synthase [Indibacter alkaliphilus]EOZ96763.1 2-Keto-3-deoxy-D-manno-octulosonate-8-phosphate synthase [Indibacter alkaliphilus LW1]